MFLSVKREKVFLSSYLHLLSIFFAMKLLYCFAFLTIIFACQAIPEQEPKSVESPEEIVSIDKTALVVLGTVQDAGSPHIGCQKDCCKNLFEIPDASRKVVSLGLLLPESKEKYLFEATPDISEQLEILHQYLPDHSSIVPDGIFLTHAHIGHYTGLMYLGREALGARQAKVYAMPKMKTFLEENGPWSQLITQENILLKEMTNEQAISLSQDVQVIPFRVPHRDEYSETVGYKIIGKNKKALFIPDIDKWEKWRENIITEIAQVDYAFLDATFYDAAEINYRDISEKQKLY